MNAPHHHHHRHHHHHNHRPHQQTGHNSLVNSSPRPFVPPQAVQGPPRQLLIVQSDNIEKSHTGWFTSSPQIAVDSSCLASPPWTRSTSPASLNSLSPPLLLPIGVQQHYRQHHNHHRRTTDSENSSFSNPNYMPIEAVSRFTPSPLLSKSTPPPQPQKSPPPPPYEPRRQSSHTPRSGRRLKTAPLIKTTPDGPFKKAEMTPCSLISTSSRPTQVRSRSVSNLPNAAFCSNDDQDGEPFTLGKRYGFLSQLY